MTEKAVVFDHLSGFQNSYINIRTVTSWSDVFQGTRKFRFLDTNKYRLDLIADVVLEKNDSLRIGLYYFTDKSVVKDMVENVKSNLLKELKELSQKTGQLVYSVCFGKESFKILTKSDFQTYFPEFNIRTELFIFLEDNTDEYPEIYCMEASHRKFDLINVLEVLVYSSIVSYLPAKKPTKFGKAFTYALAQNKVLHKAEPTIPLIENMDLPNNGKDTISPDLSTKALEKLVETSRVDEVIPPSENPPEKSPANKDSKLSEQQENLVKSVLEKEEINLSDAFQEGIISILTLLSGVDFIVNIHMDIPEIAKKACIFEKKIHILPIESDSEVITETDYGYILDTPDENIVVCSEETYPKKAKKNSGKEK